MLLLYLTSIRESGYHAKCVFLYLLCQGVAELPRKPISGSSIKRNAPAQWATTAGSAVPLNWVSISYVRADHKVSYLVHKKCWRSEAGPVLEDDIHQLPNNLRSA